MRIVLSIVFCCCCLADSDPFTLCPLQGRITFSEFLFAFIGWTDVEELIEEENEASGAAKAAAAAPAAAKVEDAPAAAKSEDAPAATSEAAAE